MIGFDWTINIGHVLTLVGAISTLVLLYSGVKNDGRLLAERLSVLGGRVINVENELKELTKVTVALVETNAAMRLLDARMTEQAARLNRIDEHGTRHMSVVMERLDRLERDEETNG